MKKGENATPKVMAASASRPRKTKSRLLWGRAGVRVGVRARIRVRLRLRFRGRV